jgi:prevent-host-death family protein
MRGLAKLGELSRPPLSRPLSRRQVGEGQPFGAAVHKVGAFDAKNKLGQLLDRVEAGKEVIITRRGKVVAKLVPRGEPGIDRERVLHATPDIRATRRGVTVGGLKIKDLIGEGRL